MVLGLSYPRLYAIGHMGNVILLFAVIGFTIWHTQKKNLKRNNKNKKGSFFKKKILHFFKKEKFKKKIICIM